MANDRLKNRDDNQTLEQRRRDPLSRMDPWPLSSPFGLMRQFSDEMDRMFDRLFGGNNS